MDSSTPPSPPAPLQTPLDLLLFLLPIFETKQGLGYYGRTIFGWDPHMGCLHCRHGYGYCWVYHPWRSQEDWEGHISEKQKVIIMYVWMWIADMVAYILFFCVTLWCVVWQWLDRTKRKHLLSALDKIQEGRITRDIFLILLCSIHSLMFWPGYAS